MGIISTFSTCPSAIYFLSLRNLLLFVVLFPPSSFMGFPRVKADGQRVYYCASRVVEARFIFQTLLSWFGEAKRFIKQTQNGCLRALARRRCLHAIFAS